MTFGYAIIVALGWAFLISVIFSLFSGRNWPRDDAGWGGLLLFFLVIWLATTSVGVWMAPAGPIVRGVPWLWFLLLAIIFALLLASSAPVARRPRTPEEGIVQARQQAADERATAAIVGFYFWILLVVLISLLVVRFVWWNTPFIV